MLSGITNGSFETGDFNGFTTAGNATIETAATIGLIPTDGTHQALIQTTGGTPTDAATLDTFLNLPAGALEDSGYTNGSAFKVTFDATAGQTLSFDYDFLSNENSDTGNSDSAFGFLGFSADVPYLTIGLGTPSEAIKAAPSASHFALQTGYLNSSNDFADSGNFTLSFVVLNQNDETIDSGLLVDNITPSVTTAQVNLANLTQTYDGAAKSVSVSTVPPGLSTTVVYKQNGNVVTPINAGSYDVTATVNDPNYLGSATDTLVIQPAQASVTLVSASLSQSYDGTAKSAQATTTPSGLTVSLTYMQNGNVVTPINAGSYDVTATVTDTNYTATPAIGALVISASTTAFSNLSGPTIVYHTASTTLSGKIAAGSLIPPGNVSITLNGVTHSAAIQNDGSFSSAFSTQALAAGSYTIQYRYAGSANFSIASDTGTLKVTYNTVLLFDNSKAATSGSTIPVKLGLTDVNGVRLDNTSRTVTALGVARSTSPNTILPSPAGGAFKYSVSDKSFQFNLKTTGLAKGTYLLYFTISGDPITHKLTFIIG